MTWDLIARALAAWLVVSVPVSLAVCWWLRRYPPGARGPRREETR